MPDVGIPAWLAENPVLLLAQERIRRNRWSLI